MAEPPGTMDAGRVHGFGRWTVLQQVEEFVFLGVHYGGVVYGVGSRYDFEGYEVAHNALYGLRGEPLFRFFEVEALRFACFSARVVPSHVQDSHLACLLS